MNLGELLVHIYLYQRYGTVNLTIILLFSTLSIVLYVCFSLLQKNLDVTYLNKQRFIDYLMSSEETFSSSSFFTFCFNSCLKKIEPSNCKKTRKKSSITCGTELSFTNRPKALYIFRKL